MTRLADKILNFIGDPALSSEPARRGAVWLSRVAFDATGIYFQPRAWPTIFIILILAVGLSAWLSIRMSRNQDKLRTI